MARFRLETRCPRLALARHQRVAEIIAERQAYRDAQDRHLETQRLVAHRDLQLVRAWSTGSRRYIRRRERLLEEARREHARAEQRLVEVGAA